MNAEQSIERNLRIMEIVEKELNQRKKESTFCFSVFLGAISVWVLLVALWEKLNRPIPPATMTYGVEVIAVLMMIVTLMNTRQRLQDMGVNRKNLKTTMLRACVICVIVVAVMVVLKLVMKPGQPLVDWSRFSPIYTLTSVLQEFLARGFLLTCLMNIYDHPQKRHISVILSSLLFTTLHLYYGFMFMVGAGILSVLLGYVYLRDENIWGVSLIHFVFGTVGTMLMLV